MSSQSDTFSPIIENGTPKARSEFGGKEDWNSFSREIIDIVMEEAIKEGKREQTKVVNFRHPDDLRQEFDLSINEMPEEKEELKEICRKTIKYSVKTAHPLYMNQLYQGFDPLAFTGIFISTALNTSQYTFEMAPVFTIVEDAVLKKMISLVGYQNADGTFCPGGSVCNMYAINLARYRLNPNLKEEGIQGTPQLVIFTSETSHYSIKKGAALLGIGTKNVSIIGVDDRGRMIPDKLEEAIVSTKAKGQIPLIVVATSGTTTYGAFDPLNEIAGVCQKYNVWMHVDAAWGGGFLLSRKLRNTMKGINHSDSMTWCLHKMMGVPLQCSGFLVNNKGNMLKECHSAAAKYLFQKDKFYDVSYDTGDKSVQCSRLPDAFKAWYFWKGKGDMKLEEEIEHNYEVARHCAELLKEKEGFRLIIEPQCTNVVFWYIPPCLRGVKESPVFWKRLSKVAPIIKEKMILDGTMMISYQPCLGKVNFFRVVIANPCIEKRHMDWALDEIDRLGRDIVV